jgi:uncharacterized membrane protein YedE/YeeE
MSENNQPLPTPSAPDPTTILLTRRRWDWYFGPAMIAIVVTSASVALATDNPWSYLVIPFFALLWIWVRFSTPRLGMRAKRLSASPPELFAILRCGTAMIALVVAVAVIDSWVTGNDPTGPMRPYHALLVGPIFVVFLARILTLAWRADRRKKEEKRRALEAAAAGDSRPQV